MGAKAESQREARSAGLKVSDQPAGSPCSPHMLQCIFQPLQYFSLTKPAATVFWLLFSDKRTGPGYGHGLMGRTTCASRPRPKEDTMKHYKNNRSRRGNKMEYSETKGYLPSREFPFIYCSSPSSRTLYFLCCSLILYCSPHSSYRLLTEDQRIRYRRRAGREPSRRMRHVAVGRATG